MFPSNGGPCGRIIQAGEAGFSVEGRVFCPDCFSAPNDGSIPFTEGTVPVDGQCGQMLMPPPPAEPSPLDPPLEAHPLLQPAIEPAAQEDDGLVDYAAYVGEMVGDENLPLPYADWMKGEALKRATASIKTSGVEAASLAEIIDEAVQSVIRLTEAAYQLGQDEVYDA